MKNNILKKLTGKYKINQTMGSLDPYLSVGSSLNSNNTPALTTKMSVPLLEGTKGQYAIPSGAGLRLVNQNRFSKNEDYAAGGLEAYLNKNINNSDASFESTIGAGIGGGSINGQPNTGVYGNADLSLYQNSFDKNTQFGIKGSYGTENAPNAGGYLGVTAKRNGLTKRGLFRGLGIEGNMGYNFKTKMPTAGLTFNLEDGGIRQYEDGGKSGMDLSLKKTNSYNCGPGVTQCGDTESPLTLQSDLGFNYNTGTGTTSAELGAGLQASLGRGDTRSGAPIIAGGLRGNAGIQGLTGDNPTFGTNLNAYGQVGFKRKNLNGAHDWSRGRAGFEAGAYGNYDVMNKNLKDVGLYGSYGALRGNVGYDMQNKGIKAGIGLNFEDGGMREYNEGGFSMSKAGSFLMKGVKAIPRVAGFLGKGAKSLTLPSLVLGAGDLGKGSTVYDENGVNKYTGETQGGNLFGSNATPPPQFNSTQLADATNYFKGAVAPKVTMEEGGLSRMKQMYDEGGVNLPGGTMTPIEGTDAVEFTGASHDDGGIQVDSQTEVEGGETMDKVVMSKGGPKDYFFSDHLKTGGMSYAQQHKNILQNGGGQGEINMLAKMQEKAANRDPKQVAKLGGVVKYEQGGVLGETFDEYVERMQAERRDNQIVGEDQFNENMRRLQRKEDRRPPIVEQKRRKLRNLQLFVDQGRELTPEQQEEYNILSNDRNLNDGPLSIKTIEMQQIPNEMPEQELAQSTDINEGIPKFIPAGPGRMDYIKNPNYFEPAEPSALNDAGVVGMSQEEVDLAKGIDNTYDAYLARTQMSGEIPEGGILSEKKYNRQQRKIARKINRQLNPGMPLEAKIGAAAQFLPAIGAMFTKQKDLEEFKYNSGFENPIIAERVKGQVYDAPNQNEARARLASSYTGQQRFLDTSGAGAAGLSNRQALFAKKLAAEGTLGAQESKDEITAENLTKKSKEQADARNAQNALAASTTNAQMAQREADRFAAVQNANVSLRNAQQNEKVTNRMNILNNFSQGIAGVMGDSMQYKADERVAKAQGLYGIYERDRLKSLYSGKINPATGNAYTDQDIALMASGLK